MNKCRICPRRCGADRNKARGVCGAGSALRAARAALHFGEEPCISGTRGSGTVFFSGCNLKCVFCQNSKISRGIYGKDISAERLSEIFFELQEKGAHNINLVTPTPYVPQIIRAIELCRGKVNIPLVYNTGGYELRETLAQLEGYIDIYLTDVKYFSPDLSKKYSGAADYFEYSAQAAAEMIRQTGKPAFADDGLLKRGTIIRHLVLPSCRKDSIQIMRELSARFSPDSFILSLMSQYTPYEHYAEFPDLNRKITDFEYRSVVDEAIRLGMTNGFMQERSSAKKEYTPPFDLYGI